MYKFIGKNGQYYRIDIKLNYNCPDSEKSGTGPGSCGGSTNSKEEIRGSIYIDENGNEYDFSDPDRGMNYKELTAFSKYIAKKRNEGKNKQSSNNVNKPRDQSSSLKLPVINDYSGKRLSDSPQSLTETDKPLGNNIRTTSKTLYTPKITPNLPDILPGNIRSDTRNLDNGIKIRVDNINKYNKNNTSLEKTLINYNKLNPITDQHEISAMKKYVLNTDLLDTMGLDEEKREHLKDLGNIDDYDTNVNYSLMNEYARNVQSGKASWKNAPKSMRDARNTIYNILEKSTLPADVTVYRGINALAEKSYISNIMKIGDRTVDGAFRSTSVNPAIAETYAFPSNNTEFIEIIEVPKGTKGRFLDNNISATDEEKEILLQSGLKYETTGINKKNGITYIHRKIIK